MDFEAGTKAVVHLVALQDRPRVAERSGGRLCCTLSPAKDATELQVLQEAVALAQAGIIMALPSFVAPH